MIDNYISKINVYKSEHMNRNILKYSFSFENYTGLFYKQSGEPNAALEKSKTNPNPTHNEVNCINRNGFKLRIAFEQYWVPRPDFDFSGNVR